MRGKQIIVSTVSGLLALGITITANAKPKPKKVDNHVMTASVVFKPTSESDLTNYVYDTVDPSASDYHQYLTPTQFAEKFGQSNAYVNMVKKYLNKYHLKTTTFAGNLAIKVSGHRADMNKAFKAKYTKAKGSLSRTKYRLPGKLSNRVVAVIGLYAQKPTTKQTKQSGKNGQQVPISQLTEKSHKQIYLPTNFPKNMVLENSLIIITLIRFISRD